MSDYNVCEETGDWLWTIEICKSEFGLTIIEGYEEKELSTLRHMAQEKLENRWREITGSIATSLGPLYNSEYLPKGQRPLTENEFLKGIGNPEVVIMEEATIDITYNPPDMFGEKYISVFVDNDDNWSKISVSLEG